MLTIEFYWSDLTRKKQAEILRLLGDNRNWDVFPFCTLELEEAADIDEQHPDQTDP